MSFTRISYEDIAYAKGEIKYYHNKKIVNSGAFSIDKSAEIKILLPRFVGAKSVCLEIFGEDMTALYQTEYTDVSTYDNLNDIFNVKLNIKALGIGLYFFRVIINTHEFILYGYKHLNQIVLSDNSFGKMLQFSVINENSHRLNKYKGGIIYHIFVDRFAKGGNIVCREDAVLRNDWEDGIPDFPEYPGAFIKNNTFFGGTLLGVIDKLDYLSSLGVTLIYLSPIFEAYSNHKYDTGDYLRVDAMFGGDESLVKLINESKKRGIGIILDGVFNHTGANSVYFNKFQRYDSTGAYQSKESIYYDWYDFQDYPDKYTCWWGIDILPRINPDIKSCGDFIAGDDGVIDKYSKLGIAGLRLDVADELSDSFIGKIKSRLLKNNTQAILYGEVWEDASNKIAYGNRKRYYLGSELDGVMNYPLRSGIISYLRDKNPDLLRYALDEVMFNAPIDTQSVMMNLLGTHDTERILTVLAGVSSKGKTNAELSRICLSEVERENGEAMVCQAYGILSTLPGIPTVFYGDEVGMEGYSDPFNRRPFPWHNVSEKLLSFYKRMGAIRRSEIVYSEGDFIMNYLDKDIMIFTRTLSKDSIATVVNNSNQIFYMIFDLYVSELIGEQRGKYIAVKPKDILLIKTRPGNSFYIEKTGEPI